MGRSIGKITWMNNWPGVITRGPAVGVILNLLCQLRSSLPGSVGILSSILFSDPASFVQLGIRNFTVVVDQGVNLLLVIDIDIWASENGDCTCSLLTLSGK